MRFQPRICLLKSLDDRFCKIRPHAPPFRINDHQRQVDRCGFPQEGRGGGLSGKIEMPASTFKGRGSTEYLLIQGEKGEGTDFFGFFVDVINVWSLTWGRARNDNLHIHPIIHELNLNCCGHRRRCDFRLGGQRLFRGP